MIPLVRTTIPSVAITILTWILLCFARVWKVYMYEIWENSDYYQLWLWAALVDQKRFFKGKSYLLKSCCPMPFLQAFLRTVIPKLKTWQLFLGLLRAVHMPTNSWVSTSFILKRLYCSTYRIHYKYIQFLIFLNWYLCEQINSWYVLCTTIPVHWNLACNFMTWTMVE